MAARLLKAFVATLVACHCHAHDSVSDTQPMYEEQHPAGRMSNVYLRKRTEKVVHRGTSWLMSKMPGAKQLFGGLVDAAIHQFVMQLRTGSASSQHFVDFLAGELDSAKDSDLGVKQVVQMVHKAANRTHLPEPLISGVREAERQLSALDAGENVTTRKALHMLSMVCKKLDMPEEVTSSFEDMEPMLDFFMRPDGLDSTALSTLMSGFYKMLGMPSEVVNAIGEFSGKVFDNQTAPQGSEAVKLMGSMVEKLGLPKPLTKMLDYMGHSMEMNTTDNATAAFAMMQEAMAGLGAPPEMAGAMSEIARLAENTGNATTEEMMSKIGGVMKGVMGEAPGGAHDQMIFSPEKITGLFSAQ